MRKLILLALFTGLLLQAAPILTITGFSNTTDSHGNWSGNYYGNVGGPELSLFCLDYFKPIAETPWEVTVTHYNDASAPLLIKQLDYINAHAASPQQEAYSLWQYMSLGASPHAEGSTGLLLSLAFVPWSTWASYVPDVTTFVPVDLCLDTQRYVEFGGTPTPEPTTAALAGLGLVLLALFRRK